jgi:acyl-coenzyme A synthetase/AMP-(fatty) acid ligase
MSIESFISKFLNNIPEIYDTNANLVKKDQFLLEYNSLKNYLLCNFDDNSTVALQFEKDYRYALSILACMEIGLTYVPLHIDFPSDRVNQIQRITNFDALLDKDLFKKIINSEIKDCNKDSFLLSDKKTLYIMFTSGSTGEPKGVEIKRESYNNFLLWLDSYFDVNENDTILNTTEFTFDVSLVDLGLFLVKQANIVFSSFGNNLFKLASEIEKYKITTIATVPNNFSMILVDELVDRIDLSSLKYAFIAGSKFPSSLYGKFNKYLKNLQVYNCFGPTEFTIYCLVKKLNNPDLDISKNTVSIGKAILNTKFKVIDDDDDDISKGEIGELVVSGIQLMKGYKNNPDKTDEAIVEINHELYYRTGDLAFLDVNDNCYVIGRKDDTVKVSGFRVNLSDVDSYIHRLKYVKDSVTICIEHEEKPNYLVSFIALNKDKKTGNELREELKNLLPSFQIPKYIEFVEDFPLNHSGKVCKESLKNKIVAKYDI